ncbi:MAG TPA: hypothetical protein VF570_03600 [Pyrinomonadaceae bacterium]
MFPSLHKSKLVNCLLAAGMLAAPLGPVAPRAAAQAAAPSAGKPPLISNSKKYKDTGEQPSTSRSGAARMSARAMLGKPDGTGAQSTDVEVTTLEAFDTGAPAPGNLERVQLKPLDQAGEPIFARNFTGLKAGGNFATALKGIARGQQVQVQGNISGVDPKRVGVVTVVADTVLRPDLAAASLNAPAQGVVNAPVNITAVVSEVNGDMSARADAVLYVGGAEVDRADDIFVNEGGTVSVAFTHTFAEAGAKSLEVRVEGVTPGDYDAANNSQTASIEVVSPAARRMNYSASAEDRTYTRSYKNAYKRWNGQNVLFYDSENETVESGRTQNAYINALAPQAAAFPLSLKIVHGSGGVEAPSNFTAASPDFSYTWDDWYSAGSSATASFYQGNVQAHIYTEKSTLKATGETVEVTQVQSVRSAGDVTYFSQGYNCGWYYDSGQSCGGDPQAGDYYIFNGGGVNQWGGPLLPAGDAYSITQELSSGGQVYKAEAVINMQPYPSSYGSPYQCNDWYDYWGSGERGVDCWGESYDATTRSGFASDYGN